MSIMGRYQVMKTSSDHAWMLDVLRDLSAYASNHELGELSRDLLRLRSDHEDLLLGKIEPRKASGAKYRRDFSV